MDDYCPIVFAVQSCLYPDFDGASMQYIPYLSNVMYVAELIGVILMYIGFRQAVIVQMVDAVSTS